MLIGSTYVPTRSVYSQGKCGNHTIYSFGMFRVNKDAPAIPLSVNVLGNASALAALPSSHAYVGYRSRDLVCPSIVRYSSQSLRFVVEDCFNELTIFTYVHYVNRCAYH